MKFTYCPHCGRELIKKEIGDEGVIPYCENCKTQKKELVLSGEVDGARWFPFAEALGALRDGGIAWQLV